MPESSEKVMVERDGAIVIVSINRPERRNAVDGETARLLYEAFQKFDADETASVAVFTGIDETFCAGADLKAVAVGDIEKRRDIAGRNTIAPMGPSRMELSKPVIAAIEGYAVAGGTELALWADMRVASETAVFGIFCRRFGVPLIDGGTIRLPRLIGQSRALDMILAGRPVAAAEALQMGLANRVVAAGQAKAVAIEIAQQLAAFPQGCLRNDRRSVLAQWELGWDDAFMDEMRGGLNVIASGETKAGATRFATGGGRHGKF
jgi:enoyl-CoA hydratase